MFPRESRIGCGTPHPLPFSHLGALGPDIGPRKASYWVRSMNQSVRVSYMVVGCKNADWEQCALEVRKAVSLHSQGTEPERLEIRLPPHTKFSVRSGLG